MLTHKRDMHGGPSKDITFDSGSRFAVEPSKIPIDSFSTDSIFGDEDQLSEFSGFSLPQKDRSLPQESQPFPFPSEVFSHSMNESPGHSIVNRTVGEVGKAAYETSTILFKSQLGLLDKSGYMHLTNNARDKGGPVLVE